jgi:hypothetical protein
MVNALKSNKEVLCSPVEACALNFRDGVLEELIAVGHLSV